MGRTVTDDHARPIAVRFTPHDTGFRASVAIEDLASLAPDPSKRLENAARRYQHAIDQILPWRERMAQRKNQRQSTTAREAWLLGDIILRLRKDLADAGFAVVDLYASLAAHAGIPYWSKRFETFRLHLDVPDLIPKTLAWGAVKSRARVAARAIAAGEDGAAE